MDAEQGLDPPGNDLQVLRLLGGDFGRQIQHGFPRRAAPGQPRLEIAGILLAEGRPFRVAGRFLGVFDGLIRRF